MRRRADPRADVSKWKAIDHSAVLVSAVGRSGSPSGAQQAQRSSSTLVRGAASTRGAAATGRGALSICFWKLSFEHRFPYVSPQSLVNPFRMSDLKWSLFNTL